MLAINPAHITETVRNIAKGITESNAFDRNPILADALEEAGCNTEFLRFLRAGYTSQNVTGTIRQIASGHDFSSEWNRLQAEEKATAERQAKAKRDAICLFRIGVTGNPYTQKELQSRITRKRPRGSGSKAELAKRLEAAMDKLANRRWKIAVKGQRKATETQAAEVIAAIESALQSQQGRAKERKIYVAGVIATARKADAKSYAIIDGGGVTANSYGYSWKTTVAYATRNADGTITVSITRSGNPSRVTFPARWWATIGA